MCRLSTVQSNGVVERSGICVVVLEDESVVRGRLVKILTASAEVMKVHQYEDNQALLDSKSCLLLDVLLADLNLPDGPGTRSIRYLVEKNPQCVTIAISVLSDADTVLAAIQAGAVGYLHKDEDPSQIVTKIHQARSGGSPISPSIARKILSVVRDKREVSKIVIPLAKQGRESILTSREKQVLEQLALGLSYHESAEALFISAKTLPVHVRNIYRKLQVRNRTEAISEARGRGLISSS